MSPQPSAKAASAPSRPERVPTTDAEQDAALYMAMMTRDLAKMARSHGFHTLAYLLEIARLEAETISGTAAPGP